MFAGGTGGALGMMAMGMSLMGLTYGPLGTVVSELFPTRVRYSGSSLAFNFAGILGASLAPYIATWLATSYGLQYVGYYLSVSAVLTFVGPADDSGDKGRRPERPMTALFYTRPSVGLRRLGPDPVSFDCSGSAWTAELPDCICNACHHQCGECPQQRRRPSLQQYIPEAHNMASVGHSQP